MSTDPFSKSSKDLSHLKKANPSFPSDVFTKGASKPPFGGGGGGRARKPEVVEEPYELLDIPSEAPAEPEKPKPSVILRNPKWEVEKVGFNEETDISVEIDLPEEHAYKTKVVFVLFAKTPNGSERVVQGEGHAEGGKAKCRIPIYIPKCKDADGNRMEKVEYFFTAKHSESVLFDGSKTPKTITGMAERLIESHILPDLTFASGKSFLHPKHAAELKEMCMTIKAWREKHPEGKLVVFGHADVVGKEEENKALSERRAKSVFGFLMKDGGVWSDLDKEEKWDLACIQDLLKHLGHDPGASDEDGPKMQAAVKSFQAKKGLPVDGHAGASTRRALFHAFMDEGHDLSLRSKNFDDMNGSPTAGCSEFNWVEKTGACEENRRVVVLLLKSNKHFPIQYPCAQGDHGVCKSQVAKKGDRRTAGFGCKFYDDLVQEKPVHANHGADKPKEEIIHVGIFFDGTDNNRDRDRPLKHDTNVSKLYDLYPYDNKTRYKFYVEGVGTGNWLKSDPFSGGFSGRGIYDRILRAQKDLKEVTEKHPGCEIRLSVFGFSRGSATALAFINYLFDESASKPGIAPNYGVVANTWVPPTTEETKRKLQFDKIWFAGIFDTVASIGMPGDDTEYTHDVSVRRSRIRGLTHFVARDERRGLFPSSSVHSEPGSPLPTGWEEKTFPGGHSDVGGGYEEQDEEMSNSSHEQGQDQTRVVIRIKKGDHLSRVAGWAMYDAALKADVPMYTIEDTPAALGTAQNAFNNILKSGKLEETPENGWTTFKQPDGTNETDKSVAKALELFSIPLALCPLWKSRGSESTFNSLVAINHPDFMDNIYPYIHDSLGLMDPKGIGQTVGINPTPRSILYRGSSK